MILSDKTIKRIQSKNSIITPFIPNQVSFDDQGKKVISYGLSSYGYDARCANEFQIFRSYPEGILDPKTFSKECEDFCEYFQGDYCIIPPNSFILTRTLEEFRIPVDVLAICLGKSTYARCGLIVNTTPLEPGWMGHITVEVSNTTPAPVKIYAGEGLLQVLFYQGDEVCEVNYQDRSGKYQNQSGITLPKLK